MNFLLRTWKHIYRYFNPEYILYISHRGQDHEIHVREFYKKSPKKITGLTAKNEEFEFVSGYPMDYQIQEYRENIDW